MGEGISEELFQAEGVKGPKASREHSICSRMRLERKAGTFLRILISKLKPTAKQVCVLKCRRAYVWMVCMRVAHVR